jgi:hypothetical protein
MYWKPGEATVLRGLWRNRIWWAIPVIVVRDDPDLTALYWRAGTPNKIPDRRVIPQELLADESLPLIDSQWVNTDVLMLVPTAASHAVYAMWEAGHTRFLCWYVNLQSPMIRTPVGLDTTDYILDIFIQPDCRTWCWKDEEEFEEAVSIGVYTPEQAQAIRAEGEVVIRQMQEGLPPFRQGWENWSPPGNWEIPGFLPGWERVI